MSASTSPVTVCQLLHSLNVGGAEILAMRLARKMSGGRWRFVFFCLDEPGVRAEEMRREGFCVETLGRKPGLDLACMHRLSVLWRKHHVHFVQAHQYTPFFYALGARGFCHSVPPLLFTEHGRFFPDLPSWKHALFNRVLVRATDRVTAVSRSVGDAVILNEGIPASRVEIIRNGVDEERFSGNRLTEPQKEALRASLGLKNERVILLTARLDSIKDHPTALRAMQRLCVCPEGRDLNPMLLLAGDGPERSAIQAFISENRLENHVRCLGERSDVSELLQIADVFLLTSRSEGIPLTILEAFASGVPVVATNVGGIPEVVTDGSNGLLVPAGDFQAVAEALRRILTEPQLSATLSDAARLRFRCEFTENNMILQYEQLFQEISAGIRS